MKNKIYILGIISMIIIVIGGVFKINHWPASGIILVLGVLFLCFIFMPAALINAYKGQGKKQKSLYIAAFITVVVDFVGGIFKIMHWPGANVILLFGILSPVILFLPVYLYYHYKNKTETLTNFLYIIFLMVYLSVMSSLLSVRVSHNVLVNAVRVNSINIDGTYISEINNQMLKQYDTPARKKISGLANELSEYIKELKIELITSASSDNEFALVSDKEIIWWKLQGIDNVSISNKILFGRDSIATNLKHRIEEYRNAVLLAVNNSGVIDIGEIEILLSTDVRSIQSEEVPLRWEEYNFNHLPLISVLNNLEQLELNVRMAESYVKASIYYDKKDINKTEDLGLSGLSNVGSLFLQFTWSEFFR